LSLIIGACGSCWAATITGRVVLPDGRPILERFVYGSAKAPNTDHTYDYLGSEDNGYYTLSDLSTGTWAVAIIDPQFIRAEIRHVEVTNPSGTYTVNFNLQSTYYAPDDNWPSDPTWRWVPAPDQGSDYAQSFVATGPSIVRATIKNAEWGEAQAIVVSICEGGPAGPQIGPSRTVESGAGHGEVSWAGGEIPVTPGLTYYLRARAQDIGDPWAPGLGYPAYPDGQLYIEGVPYPDMDMSWSISSDDDGYATSYYVHRFKWASQEGAPADEWGQTFVARSYDIQMATAHQGSAAGDLDFSIHHFDTGTQTVGAQIGPTKTAYVEKEVGRDQAGGALWSPDEVRVNPGRTYYLRVRRHDGGELRLYRFSDRYPHGNAWRDGVAENSRDLESQILGADTPTKETLTSPALPAGWNLISLPQEPTNGDPAVVFDGIDINGHLYRYTPGVGYKVYTTASPAGFGGDVKRGEGYWLHLDTAMSITYEALPQSGTQTVPMPNPGWMLIGQPQNALTVLADCQVRVGAGGTPITLAQANALHWLDLPFYWFSPTTGSYAVIGFDPWQASIFVRWRGYWIRVNQSNLEMLVP